MCWNAGMRCAWPRCPTPWISLLAKFVLTRASAASGDSLRFHPCLETRGGSRSSPQVRKNLQQFAISCRSTGVAPRPTFLLCQKGSDRHLVLCRFNAPQQIFVGQQFIMLLGRLLPALYHSSHAPRIAKRQTYEGIESRSTARPPEDIIGK